ncbi:MAG: dihydrolipoamide succinyltransferase [Gemmatimonadetes bacterium]|nr:dihydrolipoamide succinyltransferase [Gemmatimonadota bacterium]
MPQTIDILLPADQAEGTTNVVGKWFKAVGDRIETNDPLVEITTDKVTVEIAAAADGVLLEILKAEGDNVEQGQVLGRIGPVGAVTTSAPVGAPGATSPAASPSVKSDSAPTTEELAPAVRRLIKEYHLDPTRISGTGRGGRITVEDVEAFLARPQPEAAAGSRLVPHTPIRRAVAAHMVASVSTAPHVTSVFQADMSAVIAHREASKAEFAARGAKLTFTAYFVRASVAGLLAVPEVNSRWHDQALELFDHCHIGVGTALETGGLIVPVIEHAESLDLFETARRLDDLTTRARTGSLAPKEVQGGTFTISNHGVSGSLVAAPIVINQPQSAILGVGKLEPRVIVDPNGRMIARPMLYVTLTIDHRVLDGFQANAFLTKWVETIERWS